MVDLKLPIISFVLRPGNIVHSVIGREAEAGGENFQCLFWKTPFTSKVVLIDFKYLTCVVQCKIIQN